MTQDKRRDECVGCMNTDKELFREIEGDFYSPSCFMTKERMLGINVGGYVYVKPLRSWFDLIAHEKKMLDEIEKPLARIKEQNEPCWKIACEYMPTLQAIDEAIATINKYKGE